MKITCDKKNCKTKGHYVYCISNTKRYNYRNCLFYFDRKDLASTVKNESFIIDFINIPENSELMKQFQTNHPHLYHTLNKKLWKGYEGMR